jgi:hypothetical protein
VQCGIPISPFRHDFDNIGSTFLAELGDALPSPG